MDTGIPDYQMPKGVERSDLPRYQREREIVEQKQEAVRQAALRHDMTQGFVLTQYFYQQLIQFEKDPASLKDTMGEMVYSMDIDQQVHRARQIDFDQQGDGELLQRSKPRTLRGLDLAEAQLASGDLAGASVLAKKALADKSDSLQSVADTARANFILARVAIMTGHPGEAISRFQTTVATSKDARQIAWSYIYLGRMLDLDCKRDEAIAEYKLALAHRDGQQDTRIAVEQGLKRAYAIPGHSCEEDDADSTSAPGNKPAAAPPARPDVGPAANPPANIPEAPAPQR